MRGPCCATIDAQANRSLEPTASTTAIAAEAILARWPFFASVPILVVSVADVVRPWASGIAPTMYAQVLNAYAKDVAEANAEHLGVAMEFSEAPG